MTKTVFTNRKYIINRLAVITAFLLMVTVLLVLSSCNKSEGNIEAYAETCYDMKLVYEDGRASLTETVVYQNSTGENLQTLKFHLYPNAFKEDAERSPFMQSELKNVYYNGKSFGGIEVLSVRINRVNCDFTIEGVDDGILTLPCSLPAGDTATVVIACNVTLPKCNARFGVTDRTVNLTGFYPVLCKYENGDWRTEGYSALGDPFYTDSSSFYVSASFPDIYSTGASGTTTESVADGIKTVDITAEHVRDFALVLSKNFTEYNSTAEFEGRNVNVRYLSVTNVDAQPVADVAADALTKFSAAFGAYPYDTYTVIEAPVNSGGMEYGGAVIISPALTQNERYKTVIHETAHQWWYNVVGNDQVNESWLDEGLTEFCTYYYYALAGQKETYLKEMNGVDNAYSVWRALPPTIGFNANMERNLDSFITAGEYVAVIYEKGALLFHTLAELIGEDDFNACLSAYYQNNKFGIADKQALIDAFENNGHNVGSIIENWVNGKAKV